MTNNLNLRTLILLLAGVWLSVFAFPAHAADGDIEIGFLYRYNTPLLDLEDLQPDHGYGMVLRYWLNDTSTVDLELEDRYNIWEIDTPGGTEDLNFHTTMLSVGLVYLPELDFIARPTFGFGGGFMQWSHESDITSEKTGQTYLLYASTGLDFKIGDFITLGPTVRFQYYPFEESFLREVQEVAGGDDRKDKTEFEHAGVIEAGINITFKVR